MTTYKEGDFSFVKDTTERMMFEDMYAAITAADGWADMRLDPGKGGFMFGHAPIIERVTAQLKDRVGHSGASFGYTMRAMQQLARSGWATWVSIMKEKTETTK
jgi:hypothetical protein